VLSVYYICWIQFRGKRWREHWSVFLIIRDRQQCFSADPSLPNVDSVALQNHSFFMPFLFGHCSQLDTLLYCLYLLLWWIMKYIRMSDFRDAIALMRRCFMFWAACSELHWFHVFHPIYSVTFAASLFWKCFRLYICFIVQVSIASKYLFVSTVEDQVMIINCNNMMGVILLWFPSI